MHLLNLWLDQYGIWAIFAILFLESTGAPLPGETVLITGSILVSCGKLNLSSLLLSAYLGATLGNLVGYILGYFAGKNLLLRFGYLVRLTEERLEKYDTFLKKRGFFFVFSARFLPILRQINGILAGVGHMPFYKFFLANALGAAAWVLAWGAGPYLAHAIFKITIS